MPRAEKFTAASKQLVYYSDVKVTFETKPTSGELEVVTNEDSVRQSLKYLVLTSFGEIPYNPTRGSKIKTILFDPVDDMSTDFLKESLKDTCNQEPRAQIIDIQVTPLIEEQYGYSIKIAFSIINLTGQVFELGMFLTRIR